MLRKFAVVDGNLAETESESAALWLFTSPTAEEKKRLVSEFRLDQHTLNSALDPDESSRLELLPDRISLLFKYAKNYSAADHFIFRTATLGLFLFPTRLVAVIPDDIPVAGGPLFSGVNTPRSILLKMTYRIINRYVEHLKAINMVSDDIERKISHSMENRYLLNLFSLEKSMVYYLNAIGSNGFSLEKLKHTCAKLDFTPEEIDLLDDIIIDNNQCYKQAEIYSNILASLMDARASIVGNNLNILMKNLNLITIGIMVPTLVVSIFSMNVPIPMQQRTHAFWIVLALALLSWVGVVWWWKRWRL
jgi:magnesium transporter